jgi:2-(1,2-epoxy-1,2-dihydrophenyl)acetyl-CoA isomerase
MFVTQTPVAPGVICVTLNRPDRMNALSMAVVDELLSVLETLSGDPQVATIVLTGAGRGFCAGGDIKEMEQNRSKTLAQRHADLAQMHLIPQLIAEMPQVVVAAVNGAAYGAGFAVALTCDVVLASNTARFGTAFLKQGLVSDFGLSYQLTHLAGPGAARRIIFTDQVLSAVQAQNLGLVAETHDPAELLPASYDLARQIAAWPNEARGEMKTLLRRAETAPHRDMLEAEAEAQGRMIVSDSHASAVDEFNNKRPTRAD